MANPQDQQQQALPPGVDPTPIDPSQFQQQQQQSAQAPSAPPQQQQAQSLPPGVDPTPVNAMDYRPLPKAADGSSPITPINYSPLEAPDRLKLAVSDSKTKDAILRERFANVSKDDHGNLVVQSKGDGHWYRVDPSTWGTIKDSDAWTITKGLVKTGAAMGALLFSEKAANDLTKDNPVSRELMGDYADLQPGLAKAGLATVAAAAAAPVSAPLMALGTMGGTTAGGAGAILASMGVEGAAGAIGGGLGEAIRTSWGRAEGTYNATPTEQLQDVALESAYNFLGFAIGAGVKPTAMMIGEKLPIMAKAYNALTEGPKSLIKKVYGAISGVGEDAFTTLGEHGTEVGRQMREISGIAGPSGESFADEVTRRQIKHVKTVANGAEDLLSDIYKGQQRQLLKSISSDFSADVGDVTKNVLGSMVNDGFVAVKAQGKLLSPADALSALAEHGTKLPDGMELMFKSHQDVMKHLLAAGKLENSAAFDREAYGMVRQFYNTINTLNKAELPAGRAGAEQLLNANKILNDVSWKLKSKAEDLGIRQIDRMMSSYHEALKGSVKDVFDTNGTKGLFDALQGSYSAAREQMSDVLKVAEQARFTRSDQPFATLVKKISARGGTQVPIKDSFNGVINLAKQYGSETANAMMEAQKNLRVLDAAAKFNPWVRGGFGAVGATAAAGTGVGAAIGAVNPATAAMMAGSTVVSSPRVAYMVGRSAGAASDLISSGGAKLGGVLDSLWNGQALLQRLGPDGARQVAQNPQLFEAFMTATLKSPMVRSAVTNKLLAPLAQDPAVNPMASNGGQQPPFGGQ